MLNHRSTLGAVALLVAVATGGTALAAGTRLAPVTVKKPYATASSAATHAAAYAMTRVLKGLDSGSYSVRVMDLSLKRSAPAAKNTQHFTVKLINPGRFEWDSIAGTAKVTTRKLAKGWQGSIVGGSVSASF